MCVHVAAEHMHILCTSKHGKLLRTYIHLSTDILGWELWKDLPVNLLHMYDKVIYQTRICDIKCIVLVWVLLKMKIFRMASIWLWKHMHANFTSLFLFGFTNIRLLTWEVITHPYPNVNDSLTHRGRDKMDAISQTTFWSALKMFEFRLKFHWSLFLRVQLTIFQHWFR